MPRHCSASCESDIHLWCRARSAGAARIDRFRVGSGEHHADEGARKPQDSYGADHARHVRRPAGRGADDAIRRSKKRKDYHCRREACHKRRANEQISAGGDVASSSCCRSLRWLHSDGSSINSIRTHSLSRPSSINRTAEIVLQKPRRTAARASEVPFGVF